MKNLLLNVVFILLISSPLNTHHFIGLKKEETKVLSKSVGYFPDNVTTSQKFNYLKFVNAADTKTLIVFFSENNIATHTRIVCDYSEYDFIINDFNKEYKKRGKNLWEYRQGGEKYEVSLEEKEWYFVVRTKKK